MLSTMGPKGLFLFLMLLLSVAGVTSPVYAVDLNAYWQYRQSGGGNRETQSQFQQRYSLGVGPAVSYQPSHAITASAAMGYTRTESDAGKGVVGIDQLSPSAQVNLVNDIFRAHLSGNSSTFKSQLGAESTNTTWDATLASAWSIPFWPNVLLNYSERTENSDEASLFDTSGPKEKNTSISLSWNLILAEFSYRYNNNQNEDPSDNTLVESDSHFARFGTQGRFWEDRFTFNLSQQFRYTTQDIIFEAEDADFFLFALEGETLYAVTDPAILLDPLPGETWTDQEVGLVSVPELGDEDVFDVPQEVQNDPVGPGQRVHLGVSFGSSQTEINIIRVTLDQLTTLTEAQANAMQWDLYLRDPAGTDWELAVDGVPFTYDDTLKRFDLTINDTDSQFMVVAVAPANIELQFTEVEAFELLSEEQGDTSTTITGYLTNLGMGYQITRTLRASASMTLDLVEVETGNMTQDSDRRGVSGHLRWSPSTYVLPSIGFSEYRDQQINNPENISRSYSLTVPTFPLPSLTVTYGATLSERYSGELKTDTTKRHTLLSKAQIYPDLTASWTLSLSDGERMQDDGTIVTSSSITNRFDLNAQLHRKLRADILTNYRKSENDTDNFQSGDVTLMMKYRPSDLLALRGDYTTFFGDLKPVDRINLGLFLVLMRTHKGFLELNVTHREAQQTSDNFALTGSWTITKNLSVQTRGNYGVTDGVDAYSFLVSLAMSL